MLLLLQAPTGGIPLRAALRDALSWHAALTAAHVPLHDGRASLSARCVWAGCVPRAYPPTSDTPTAAPGGVTGGGEAAVRRARPSP